MSVWQRHGSAVACCSVGGTECRSAFSDGADDIPVRDLIVEIVPAQSGSGVPSPDNVRPISGWTGANVYVAGKNLLYNPDWHLNKTIDASGVEKDMNGYKNSGTYIPVMGGETVTGQIYKTTSVQYAVMVACYDKNKTFIERFFIVPANSQPGIKSGSVTLPDNCRFIRFICDRDSYNEMLEYGNTASTYVGPVAISEYSVSWQDEAGTIYGGTLDMTTGVLTVTHAYIASYAGESIHEPWISSMDAYSVGGTPTTGAQVVYPLTTAQTYQLTPTEVKTLLGTNNILADTGDTTAQYRADPALYAGKEARNIMLAIAPIEDGDKASQAYAAGKYFYHNGNFCKAKTSIASGATFTLNTNYEETTVAAELFTALNT